MQDEQGTKRRGNKMEKDEEERNGQKRNETSGTDGQRGGKKHRESSGNGEKRKLVGVKRRATNRDATTRQKHERGVEQGRKRDVRPKTN